uniref:mRNA, clone: RTFL01-02-M11 n=1 Tax=Eutrema halophilum TaxID=98038 RepID=E4MVI0_EUTHA|nr:unnamed protein product [Eutrema halophilum]
MELSSSLKLSSPLSPSIINLQLLQGTSSSNIVNFSNYTSLPKPFLQHDDRSRRLRHQQASHSHSVNLRSYRKRVTAKSESQGWDFGRFVKTLYFFNGPPSPLKFVSSVFEKLTNGSTEEPVNEMETSGIILVAGATGGVGRRVVDILRKRGLPVKALVRNEEKARKMLGPDIDLIFADITKENTLVPEKFKGVRKVINAVSVIVGPKEGDTPERQKYNQGVRFFEPEIKGDSPELVEYIGMKNLINAVKDGVGLENGKLLFGVGDNTFKDLPWGALDDVVMGGVSESNFLVDLTGGENGGPTGIFKGIVSTTNNGGFTSVRTKVTELSRGRESLCI